MSSFIIVIPPWSILESRFGLSDDMKNAIASEDDRITYAWSDYEDTVQLGENRELIVYSPKTRTEHYYYNSATSGEDISLPMSFIEFCVAYREKPLYGITKLIGSYHD